MPRHFTREFKLEACRLIRTKKMSQSYLSRRFGLSNGMLDRWLAQYDALGEDSFWGRGWRVTTEDPSDRLLRVEFEIQTLEREAERLRSKIESRGAGDESGSAE